MSRLSTAQVLPAHVLKSIALFVLVPLHAWNSYSGLPQLPEPEPAVRLARVCRDWYQAIVPLCYRVARLGLARDEAIERCRPRLALQQAVDSGRQQSVRQLVVQVYWFDSGQLQDVVSLLDGCGQLPGVCKVLFDICPELWPAEVDLGVEGTADLADRITRSFAPLVDAIARTMPGIRSVGVSSYRACEGSGVEQSLTVQLLERACGLVDAQTAELCLAGHAAINRVPTSLAADSLRSVMVINAFAPDRAIELVRRNSGSVEKLHIDTSHSDDFEGHYGDGVSHMLFRDRAPGEAIEYPRLKSLYMNEGHASSTEPVRLQANPLPSVEVLHLEQCRSFPTAAVLRGSRARLRSLYVDLNAEDKGWLVPSSGLLADGGFPSLERVTMRRYARVRGSLDWAASWMLAMLGSCPRARAACIQGTAFPLPQEACDSLRLPPSVQRLDLTCFHVTVDQAMAIFGACPRLQVARLRLGGRRGGREDLTAAAVGERRARYAGHAPGIRHLVLCQVEAAGNPRGGELVLTLASLLPAVARVWVPHAVGRSAGGFLEHVQRARERPPFSDVVRLRSIDFCVADVAARGR